MVRSSEAYPSLPLCQTMRAISAEPAGYMQRFLRKSTWPARRRSRVGICFYCCALISHVSSVIMDVESAPCKRRRFTRKPSRSYARHSRRTRDARVLHERSHRLLAWRCSRSTRECGLPDASTHASDWGTKLAAVRADPSAHSTRKEVTYHRTCLNSKYICAYSSVLYVVRLRETP